MADPITLLVTSLGAGAGKAGIQEASNVLRDLIGLQDAQLRLWGSIDRKVDALLHGPFHTGRRKLEDALAPGRPAIDREHLPKEARTFFDIALGQDIELLRRSLAALHLAGIWLALASPMDVPRPLEEAHIEAVRGVVCSTPVPATASPLLWAGVKAT